ncbi:MAG: hypothetical protein ACLRT4_11900 [Thomasclavelia sp.]
MSTVVHFNMVVEINQLLKGMGIEYSIHSVGGCTCSGLELRRDGHEYSKNEIIRIINDYLDDKWMRVVPDKNYEILNIESKFDYEK